MKKEIVPDCSAKIGLALSGGGFRATLFHIGVIRYLYDTRKLANVTHISSVSGGSILAAEIVLKWGTACTNFEEFAKPIILFIQSDVRGRIVRRWPLITAINWIPGFWWLTASYLLERYYSKELYAQATLSKLKGESAPSLHLLVTSLSYPEDPAAFSSEGFQNFVANGSVETGRPSVGLAVAASSALPILFPPIKVDASSLHVQEKQLKWSQQYVTDGGVYDNLGLRPLRIKSAENGFGPLIISDAGAMSDWSPRKSFRTMASALGRVIDVLFDRIRRLEEESATITVPEDHPYCTVSIHKTYRDCPIKWFTPDVQRNLPLIRTDLDIFSNKEITALVLHGQLAARRELAEKFGIVPAEDYVMWNPFADSTPIQPEELDGSSRRQVRILVKDSIYWVYALILVCCLGVLWMMFQPAPYEVLFSNIVNPPSQTDVSNHDFVISKRSVVIDMRSEVAVPDALKDKSHASPSIHEYLLNVTKGESNPSFLAYDIISQRRLAEVFCTSDHPYEVRFRVEDGIAGKGLQNVWTIIIDTSKHIPNIPFTVSFRLVRFNAYQAPSNNWVGLKVSDNEKMAVTTVLLPNKTSLLQEPNVVTRRISSDSEAPFKGSSINMTDDKTSFTWTVPDPQAGTIYKAYMNWQKQN